MPEIDASYRGILAEFLQWMLDDDAVHFGHWEVTDGTATLVQDNPDLAAQQALLARFLDRWAPDARIQDARGLLVHVLSEGAGHRAAQLREASRVHDLAVDAAVAEFEDTAVRAWAVYDATRATDSGEAAGE